MPVCLDAIPHKAAIIARPETKRWLLFLVFVMLGGLALTVREWTTERAGFVFWFTAIGLPFCCWGLLYGLRRFAYKAEQVGAECHNLERDALIEREIKRGQRCAWILGAHIQTSAGNNATKLLSVMTRSEPVFDFSTPRGYPKQIRYAALNEFQTNQTKALKDTLSILSKRVNWAVKPLPGGLPCWLMLDCDSDLYPDIEAQLKAELSQKSGRVFHLMSGKGLAAFDVWLDKHWDNPGILIAITLSLPAAPLEGDADAVSMVTLSNRRALAYPDALRLHRPERGTTTALGKTLKRALLWAKLEPSMLQGSWISGPQVTQGSCWIKACEENGVIYSLSEDNFSIDPVLGYTRYAAPWVAIILASSAFDLCGTPVIAAHPVADLDDIWVAVITKEETSNK